MNFKILVSGLEKKYIAFSILTPVVMIGEVLMETVIPMIMAHIIDDGISNKDLGYVVSVGILISNPSFSSLSPRISSTLLMISPFKFRFSAIFPL